MMINHSFVPDGIDMAHRCADCGEHKDHPIHDVPKGMDAFYGGLSKDKTPEERQAMGQALFDATHNDVEDVPGVEHPKTMLYDPPPEDSVFSQQTNTPVANTLEGPADQPTNQYVGLIVFASHVSQQEAEFLIGLLREFGGSLAVKHIDLIQYQPALGHPHIIFK